MEQAILEQRDDRPLEQGGVSPDAHGGKLANPDPAVGGGRVPAGPENRLARDIIEEDRLRDDIGGRFAPGQEQEVADQLAQLLRFGRQAAQGILVDRRGRPALGDADFALKDGERGPELVGRVRKTPALIGERLVQSGDQHAEGILKPADFIAPSRFGNTGARNVAFRDRIADLVSQGGHGGNGPQRSP